MSFGILASRQVVVAIADALRSAGTAAGAEVNSHNREHPFTRFPGLRVYAIGEDLGDADDPMEWPLQRQHDLRVMVDACVRDALDVETAMAALALEVLQALEAAEVQELADISPRVYLRARRIDYSVATQGEQTTGTARIEFSAEYSTVSDAPETIL